jgi:hypothetical protein
MTDEIFTQIIFPPLPRTIYNKTPLATQRFDINNKPMKPEIPTNDIPVGAPYWFQFYPDRSDFMCRCPVCNLVYCYSSMKPDTDTGGLLKTVLALKTYYNQEFEWFCPDRNNHEIITFLDKRKGYNVYEEYAEEYWSDCVMR